MSIPNKLKSARFPLSPEQQEWMRRMNPVRRGPCPNCGGYAIEDKGGVECLACKKTWTTVEFAKDGNLKPVATPPAPPVFTDPEIAWLWPRFQKCRHQVYSFANSFAKTALDRLTPKGKAILHNVAFPYRRQIFAGSAKWDLQHFIEAVRRAAIQPEKE